MPKEIRLRTETLTMYDRSELAEIFGVSAHSVWCWIKSGRLPGQLIGGKWYVTEDAVRSFLNGKTETREAYYRLRNRLPRGRNAKAAGSPEPLPAMMTAEEAEDLWDRLEDGDEWVFPDDDGGDEGNTETLL